MSKYEEGLDAEGSREALHRRNAVPSYLLASDINDSPAGCAELAATKKVSFPAFLSAVPAIAHHFHDQFLFRKSEVCNHGPGRQVNRVLQDRSRQSCVDKKVEELTLEVAIDLSVAAPRSQGAPDRCAPFPASSADTAKSPLDLREVRLSARDRLVKHVVELREGNFGGDVDEGLFDCCARYTTNHLGIAGR